METIQSLDLTKRTSNCLKKKKITTIDELSKLSLNDLLKIKGLGRSCMEEIIDKMRERGIDILKNSK